MVANSSSCEEEAMNKVILDDMLRAKLNGLDQHLELCDENGHTVGHYLPAEDYKDLLVDWSKARVSDEELDRRMQEPGGCTLAEIWERLGNP
jgi:hypothetical protein